MSSIRKLCSAFAAVAITSAFLVSCQLFTAVSDLEESVKVELRLVHVLRDYIAAEERRLEQLQRFVQTIPQSSGTRGASGDLLAHPVSAFQLVKRMHLEWDKINNTTNDFTNYRVLKANLSKYQEHIPRESDLRGVARALLRLEDVYQLEPQTIADGQIGGVSGAAPLKPEDCFDLGRAAFLTGDQYHAQIWFNQALAQFKKGGEVENSESKLNVSKVLDYLAFSHYKAGNIKKALNLSRELLKHDPHHGRVLKNVENYVEEIDEREREQSGILQDKPNSRPPSSYLDNREQYESLCRGERNDPHTPAELSKLKCYLVTNGNSGLIIGPVKKEYLNLDPEVVLYHDVITDEEIKTLIELAKPRLQRSLVVHGRSKGVANADFRLSRGGWLEDSVHPVVARLTRRISTITGLSTLTEPEHRHAEHLQVVNYGLGGHYEPHFDHAMEKDLHDVHLPGSGNRMATWMFYMSNVTAGGYTVFPEADVFVRPIKNAAVFWYNLKPSGRSDDMTRHAGCPVLIGNKWVANKWIHEKGNEFNRPCNLQPEAVTDWTSS